MPEDFVIARNPEADSSLPYLLRIPLPGSPVVLKAKDTWPRTSKIYCHRSGWSWSAASRSAATCHQWSRRRPR